VNEEIAMKSQAGHVEDPVSILHAYQAACNRHDIDACVALFAEDGAIVDAGRRYAGSAAVRAAHEYDAAVGGRVAFEAFAGDGEAVTCRFVFQDELDRLLGLDGFHQRARFAFAGGRIREFAVLGAEAEEIARHRGHKGPFLAWATAHHPEALAKRRELDRAGGEAFVRLARAWDAAGRPAP
jgi:hypothetical protein